MEDETFEDKYFITFEKHQEFRDAQDTFLSLSLFEDETTNDVDGKEKLLYTQLSNILNEYQEQSYLLDPYLEDLVTPVVESLKAYAKTAVVDHHRRSSPQRVRNLTLLLYNYIKCRGYKTIIRFFSHEIGDLAIVLDFILLSDGLIRDPSQWALRYVILLWLSLICMLPFDMSQYDSQDHPDYTETTIETAARGFLSKAGLECESAALVLARLYTRKDASSRFHSFLQWSHNQLETSVDAFLAIGILRTLCEIIKFASAEQVKYSLRELFSITTLLDKYEKLIMNTTVRKLKVKLISRIALRLLPVYRLAASWKSRDFVNFNANAQPLAIQEDFDVPEHVEIVLDQLLEALQDRDTIVRWSAAKGIARASERLPHDLVEQVLESVINLFSIHSVAAASLYDFPSIAEGTWHGACLACAEMARRDLVRQDKLPELVQWLSKALFFDIRKGAHSIGSGVRDAAAYSLWAIARTQNTSVLAPFSLKMAQSLEAVALFDREIHIRRAASAAFQEHVGRNGLFPHGIDVLAKSDYHAVGNRRNAYLICAPEVADHHEYREFLLDHLLDVVLRHWDPKVKELGSQSLRLVCLKDLRALGSRALLKASHLLRTGDITDLYGGLLALVELAKAYRDFEVGDELTHHMREIFGLLSQVPLDVVNGPRNPNITAAACRLISVAITVSELSSDVPSSAPQWKQIIDHGIKFRAPIVQAAAAEAMTSLSTLIRELKTSSPVVQQSLGTVLGALDYNAFLHSLPEVLECIFECLKPTSPLAKNIEARRNCYFAIPRILSSIISNLSDHMSYDTVNSLFEALLNGLDDYSSDQRGDVGSWIRIACIQGLTTSSELLISNAKHISPFNSYFPPALFQRVVSGILKQGVERLDNVRQEAGENLLRLLSLGLPTIENGIAWELPGSSYLKELFQNDSDYVGWKNADWLFPRAVRLLNIREYRKPVLAGLILSLSSRTDSTQRPASISFVSYVQSLPTTSDDTGYDVHYLFEDILSHMRGSITSNTVVVPVFKAINVLLEAGCLDKLSNDTRGLDNLRYLLSSATRNVARLKHVLRIHESMKIVVNLFAHKPLFGACLPGLLDFLTHPFPSIRRDTAESMYLVLQSVDLERDQDTDEVEEILLETEWSSDNLEVSKEAAMRIADIFS